MARWINSVGDQVNYKETVRTPMSPAEALGNNNSQIEKTYLVDWDNRFFDAYTILGYPIMNQNSSGTQYISRANPMWHSDFQIQPANTPFLYATQIRHMEPLGAPSDGNWVFTGEGPPFSARYLKCKMTVLFETLTYDILDDGLMPLTNGVPDEASMKRNVTRLVQPGADYLSLPQGTFKYVLAGTPPVPGSPPKLQPQYDLTYIWHMVPKAAVGLKALNPTLTTPAIDTCLGKVNSLAFDNWAAGTLVCLSPNVEPIRSPFGDRLYNIHYRFKWVPFGQNNIFRPASNAYLEVSTDGLTHLLTVNGVHIYDAADFNTLFRVST